MCALLYFAFLCYISTYPFLLGNIFGIATRTFVKLQEILYTGVCLEGLLVKDGQEQVTAYERWTPHLNEQNDKNYSFLKWELWNYLWGFKENCLDR